MKGGTGWSRQAGGAALSTFSGFGPEKKRGGAALCRGQGGPWRWFRWELPKWQRGKVYVQARGGAFGERSGII
jgi:hypothetical protein